jgi:uncharacterized SAM-binding protein YcdF (DUF218 family)
MGTGDLSPELTRLWAFFSWSVYFWLARPWLMTLTLLSVMAVVFLFHRDAWKTYLRGWLLLALVLYWVLISPLVATLAVRSLMLFVPPDTGEQADAIVIISRSEEVIGDRYERGIQLWQRDRAPQLFVTALIRIISTQASLRVQGIPDTILSGSICAITTYDEALFTAAILGPQGVRKIILVTDPPQMLRAWLTFRGMGFTVIPHYSPLPVSVNSAEKVFLTVREYLGLASYALLGRFRRRPPELLQNPPESVQEEMAKRYCAYPHN